MVNATFGPDQASTHTPQRVQQWLFLPHHVVLIRTPMKAKPLVRPQPARGLTPRSGLLRELVAG